jgi:flagellar hook-length control protein FliK
MLSLEAMHGPPDVLDARPATVAQPAKVSTDFAAVLAESCEETPAHDEGVRQTKATDPSTRNAASETQSPAIRAPQAEPDQESLRRARTASGEDELLKNPAASPAVVGVNLVLVNPVELPIAKADVSAADPDTIAVLAVTSSTESVPAQSQSTGLLMAVTPATESVPAQSQSTGLFMAVTSATESVPAQDQSADLLMTVTSATESIPAQSQSTGLFMAVTQQLVEAPPDQQPRDSAALTVRFLQAMFAAIDGTDGDPATLTQAMIAEENSVNAQIAPQTPAPAAAPAIESPSNLLTADTPAEAVDLATWLKTLALALRNESTPGRSEEVAPNQPLGRTANLLPPEKDAQGSDPRIIVSVAQGQETLAPKQLPVTASRVPEQVTLALVDKLALQSVRYLISHGEKTITVQLVPPSLGELRIEISTVKDTLNVSLISGNSGVRDVLQGHAPALREALARAGIEVVHVAVLPTLAGHAAAGQNAGHAPPDFQRMTSAVRASFTKAESETGLKALYTRIAPHDGTLNLFV